MKDFPELTQYVGSFESTAAERGTFLRQAERHLVPFSRWMRTKPWSGRAAVLYSAQIYCIEHGLPPRMSFIQNLAQAYEQQALGLIDHPFPPLLKKKKWTFFSFGSKPERAPPTLS